MAVCLEFTNSRLVLKNPRQLLKSDVRHQDYDDHDEYTTINIEASPARKKDPFNSV